MGTFFAASLGARSLTAQMIASQTMYFSYLIVLSIGDAGNILIGRYLGAGQPKEAANANNVTYTLALALLAINALFVVVIHRWLPLIFNISASDLPFVRNILLLIAVATVFDGLNFFQTTIVKAW